jgi:hypothetical protein
VVVRHYSSQRANFKYPKLDITVKELAQLVSAHLRQICLQLIITFDEWLGPKMRKHKSLEEQISQLEAKKKSLQARLNKQDRAKETRRKILLGALVLDRVDSERDPEFSRRLADWLRRELPGFLVRDMDRDLFTDLLEPHASTQERSEK